MPATASDLQELHELHRRARALKDRLESAPKTLAARRRGLEKRRQELEAAQAALRAKRSEIQKRELTIQTQRARVDDLRIKLNQTRKNDEYKAIQNEIAAQNKTISRLEDESLEFMQAVETDTAALKTLEAEFAKLNEDVEALAAEIESKTEAQRAQFQELETAIHESESVVPEDDRERYRRTVRQRGDDAFAPVDQESRACHGCFQVITLQGLSELMSSDRLVFCNCGRILYLEED